MPVTEWADAQGVPRQLLPDFVNRVNPRLYQQIIDFGPYAAEMRNTCTPMRELWIPEGASPSHKARKWESSAILNERFKMQKADFLQRYADACDKASATLDPNAEFRTGQSVHQWWAGWFAKAETVPSSIQGKKRPAWYFGEILMAMGKYPIKYAGRMWDEPNYLVF